MTVTLIFLMIVIDELMQMSVNFDYEYTFAFP